MRTVLTQIVAIHFIYILRGGMGCVTEQDLIRHEMGHLNRWDHWPHTACRGPNSIRQGRSTFATVEDLALSFGVSQRIPPQYTPLKWVPCSLP